jgi:methionyl-tRNA synthetase
MDRCFVTTPIYYVNGAPHLGHAHTSIMADILKRIHRMRGTPTALSTGTDEHGQKNQEAAAAAGLEVQAYLDRQSAQFREQADAMNVGYDWFIRTSDPVHKAAVQEALRRVHAKGLIEKREYTGLYCVGCEQFKKKTDLDEQGRCPDHQVAPVTQTETNYFFALGRFQEWLLAEIERRPDWIRPDAYRREVLKMLDGPLDDLCISRPKSRVTLGIELPFDPDFVTYVWFDALLNYLTVIGWPDDRYLEWWPGAVHLMAKDIVKTHCVYWPIMLKALDIEPPAGYRIHGYWVGEGNVKMSKSLGNVVDPAALTARIGVDPLRYYLARTMKGGDSQISDGLVFGVYNGELANNIGNLYSRTVKLAAKQFEGRVPSPETLHPDDAALCDEVASMARAAFDIADLDTLPDLGQAIVAIGTRMNLYFDRLAPWTLAKQPTERPRLASGLYATLDALRTLFELVAPIMPTISARALRNLGLDPIPEEPRRHEFASRRLPNGNPLGEDSALFPRLQS